MQCRDVGVIAPIAAKFERIDVYRVQPGTLGAEYVDSLAIADVKSLTRLHTKGFERKVKDPRIGLCNAYDS